MPTDNQIPADGLLTADQLATKLQFTVRKVRQWVSAGKLPVIRLNRRDLRFHWPTVLQRLNK